MKLYNVSVCKCKDDCKNIKIKGKKSKDSVFWDYENVDVKFKKKLFLERNHDSSEDYMDIYLSCGCTIAYVEVEKFNAFMV